MAEQLTLHVDPGGDLLESARDCEAEVFLRWYGNTREQLAVEYGPYEHSSVFLAIVDQDGCAQAAARLLRPGGTAGLKTLTDIGREPWGVDGDRVAAAAGLDLSSTWEVATISVRRRHGPSGLRLSLALYHGLISLSSASAMSSFVAVLDERVRRLLASVGLPTITLPGTSSAPYLGSTCSTPVYARCAAVLEHQRREHPDAYRLVTLGVGLDGIALPRPDAYAVALTAAGALASPALVPAPRRPLVTAGT
ncbi:MAG TPA: hypothetical protein VGK35_01235 [Actinotalea sp.]